MIAQAFGRSLYREPVRQPTRPDIEAVDSIRKRVLSPAQLDALAGIQDGLVALSQLERQVNDLLLLHGVDVKGLNRIESGRLWHDIEGLLFAHNSAAARLRNAGVPLQVPTTTEQRRVA
jgi:hypothetical protein